MKKNRILNYVFEVLITAVVFFVLRMLAELVFDTESTWKDISLWAIFFGICWVPTRRFLVKKGIIEDEFKY